MRIALLKEINNNLKEETTAAKTIQSAVRQLMDGLLRCSTRDFSSESASSDAEVQSKSTAETLGLIKEILDKFGSLIFDDESLSTQVDYFVQDHLSSLLRCSGGPPLILSYFSTRNSQTRTMVLWQSILGLMNSTPEVQVIALPTLFDGISKGLLPSYLHPGDDDLSDTAGKYLASLFDGSNLDQTKLDTVKHILKYPSFFLSRQMSVSLVHKILYGLREKCRRIIRPEPPSSQSLLPPSLLASVGAPLELLLSTLKVHHNMLRTIDSHVFLSDIFILAFLLNNISGNNADAMESVEKARQIWELNLQGLDIEGVATLRQSVKAVLRDLISDVDCCVS